MSARVVACAHALTAPADLEERFPGRWDPRRALSPELRPLIAAGALAQERAGWGPDPRAALVIGVAGWGLEPARAFQAQLARAGEAPLRPSAFLSSLPSTPAATLALLLGHGGWQATLCVPAGERPLRAALEHALELLQLGRATRALVAAPGAPGPAGAGGSPSRAVALEAAAALLVFAGPGYLCPREGATVSSTSEQRLQVKRMLVEQLHLRMDPSEIGDQVPLFGEAGLGLDSVDAIELVSGVESRFGYSFPSEDAARKVLTSVAALADHLAAEGKLA